MKAGIRTSVLFLALAPATLIALVLVTYLTNTRIQDLEQSLMDRGQAIARQLATACEYGVFSANGGILNKLARSALQEPDLNSITIQDARGNTLISLAKHQPQGAQGGTGEAPGPVQSPLLFQAPIYRTEVEAGGDFRRSALDERSMIGRVSVELSREATEDRQREVAKTSLLLTFLCLSLAAVLGQRIGRKISHPILRLESAVREVGQGRLDIHTPENSTGELGSLERGINAMVAALKASHEHLQDQVDEATKELRETMEELEVKNVELDIARKKAVQASRVKSEFLANMSHEIRTPMNGVMGFIELLAKTDLNRTQQGYLQTLRASAENLMIILNDILDFSKIEAGKFKIRHRHFDLREVLENAVLLFAANAQYKGINLILDIEPDVPSNVVGDAPRIAQIVTNFVSNAVKFTDQGEVEVRVSKAGESTETINLNLMIRDTGTGIALRDQGRLFNAFDQLDASTTRRHSGTGLGLAITHRLVTLMDGSIHVESRLGEGSAFFVSLQLKKQDAEEVTAERRLGPRPLPVLLVSTNRLLARAVTHILEFGGARPHHAADFTAAAEWLDRPVDETGAPRDIILDYNDVRVVPEGFLARVRRRGLGRHCALILMGANEEHSSVRSFTQVFRTVYFANKPPTARELLALLDTRRPSASAASGPAEQGAGEEIHPARGEALGIRVLLADDNLINRQLARIFLNQLGVRVDEAGNGAQAVESCRHNRYDLILMDIHMPEMDGLEATQRIRTLEDNPNSSIPVVALTADALNRERDQYLDAGMNDHLSKPITQAALQQMLEKWCLGGNSGLTANSKRTGGTRL